MLETLLLIAVVLIIVGILIWGLDRFPAIDRDVQGRCESRGDRRRADLGRLDALHQVRALRRWLVRVQEEQAALLVVLSKLRCRPSHGCA